MNLFGLLAFTCPDKQQEALIEEGNIQFDIDFPGNAEVDPADVVTSNGVNVFASDSIIILFNFPPSRIMDMDFVITGAEKVILTFQRRQIPDEILQVLIHSIC